MAKYYSESRPSYQQELLLSRYEQRIRRDSRELLGIRSWLWGADCLHPGWNELVIFTMEGLTRGRVAFGRRGRGVVILEALGAQVAALMIHLWPIRQTVQDKKGLLIPSCLFLVATHVFLIESGWHAICRPEKFVSFINMSQYHHEKVICMRSSTFTFSPYEQRLVKFRRIIMMTWSYVTTTTTICT